ncbi:MAG: DUF2188 domain-containing protein [Chlorobium sp.]
MMSDMAECNQHVVPKDDRWAVRKQGAMRSTKVFSNQREAINFARDVARKQSGELFIHKADGTIHERRSYGNNPSPPPDKK